jgi:hypothetical protein
MLIRAGVLLVTAAHGVRFQNRGILDGIDVGNNKPTAPPFIYKPSNSQTKPPQTFADEIVVDDAYHELVPALAVLSDLTTTTPAPSGAR